MLQSDGPHCFAHRDLAIGSLQHGHVLNRELLLGRAELGVVLARLESLGVQRVKNVADDRVPRDPCHQS